LSTVYLIRHAQGSFGSEDYDVLSERGHEQVAALADGLRARGAGSPARVVSGSLRRQRDTAVALGVDVAVDPRWNEYDDRDILQHHGELPAGLERRPGDPPLSSREFQGILNGALGAWIAAGAGGRCSETWPAFRARALEALEELAESLGSGDTALVVSSGGVIGALTACLLGLPDSALIAFNHVSINTGITKLAVGRNGITVISVNEHGHLERSDGSLVTYR
jgi:broad specificity phosphatase PhoE